MAVAFSATAIFGAEHAVGVSGSYDVAAFVWPAYQPEPRWAELGIFKAGKGEWQNVWEAVPKWEGHRQPLKPLWGYENEAEYNNVEVYMTFVRKKLAFIGSKTAIKAVRGVGYELRGDNV